MTKLYAKDVQLIGNTADMDADYKAFVVETLLKEIDSGIKPYERVEPTNKTRFNSELRKLKSMPSHLGLNSEPCKKVLANIPELLDGNMIVLSGGIGCGKTFAAQVGAFFCSWCERFRTAWRKDTELDVLKPFYTLVTAPDYLRTRFDKDAYDVADDHFLIIDDLGREHFTDSGFGIAEWDRLFDNRYSKKLPTVITTNLTPDELKEIYGERIYDRLKQCATWCQFGNASLRTKS